MRFEKTFSNGWTDRFEVLEVHPSCYTPDWILNEPDPVTDDTFKDAEFGQKWFEWKVECFEAVATKWDHEFMHSLFELTFIFRPNMKAIIFQL